MASTRNKHTPCNARMEQQRFAPHARYMMSPHAAWGVAYQTQLPGNGLLPGQLPWDQLSHNAPDTESFLWGIGSTVLDGPQQGPSCFVPQIRTLSSADIYQKAPVHMPMDFRPLQGQRPSLH